MTSLSRAVLQLELAIQALGRLASRHEGSGNILAPATYLLLTYVELVGQAVLTRIALGLGQDKSTVSRQVASAVRAGLLQRRHHESDGRCATISLTPAGRQQLQLERERRSERLADITADWSAEDRQQLTQLLARFNCTLEQLNRIPWPR